MGPDLTNAIIAGVSALIAAASALYTRQQALPLKTKHEVCQNLLRLRDALNDVGHTGHAIGRLMRADTLTPGNPDLRQLINLLEDQNRNLIRAKTVFKSLATVFDIHAPELSRLTIHLRGKSNRIELVYSVATDHDVRRRLRESLQGWERSKFLQRPEDIIPVVYNRDPYDPIGPFEITRDQDKSFELILECIPQLTDFIRTHCPIENLT